MEKRTLKVNARPIPVRFSTDTLVSEGEIVSLSTKGLFVRTSEFPPVGASVRLVFEDRGAGKTEIVGEVRWTTEQLEDGQYTDPGFGLRFTEWSESYHNFFERMLFAAPSSDVEETKAAPAGPSRQKETSTEAIEEEGDAEVGESPDREERRRGPRVTAPSPVYFISGREEGMGMLADLSLTGARIDASPRLKTGVAMKLLLELRQEAFTVELPGRVVRETETGFAIEFTFEPDSPAEASLRWILRRPKRLKEPEPE